MTEVWFHYFYGCWKTFYLVPNGSKRHYVNITQLVSSYNASLNSPTDMKMYSHVGRLLLAPLNPIFFHQIREKLEALRQRRPPWRRQIITPILPTVKMLSLGGERLPPQNKQNKKTKQKRRKKVLDHYLHHDLGMLPLLWCFFAHLVILQYTDYHHNLISSSLYYPGPFHNISSQSISNFLSNVVYRQTDKQTNQRYQKHNLLCQGGNCQGGKNIHQINMYSDIILFRGKTSAIVYCYRSTLLCTIDVIPSIYSHSNQHLYYQNNINVFTLPYTLSLSSFLRTQVLYFYYITTKVCMQPNTSTKTF